MMRAGALAVLFLVPAPLVGGAIALSPDPSGAWSYPLGQRLLYVHVPLAWAAYLGFLGAAASAVLVLWRRSSTAGRYLRALVEVTTVVAAAALFSGLAWSYEFPLFDPLADPVVLSTIVLVASLGGLWALASSSRGDRRDALVASLTVVALATVPASYFASRLATPHPDLARPESSLDPAMALLLAASTLGFTMLVAGLVGLRLRLLALEEGRAW